MKDAHQFDIAVVGAGPAGLVAGLACAASGLKTAVIGPRADAADGRVAALLNGSINVIKRLGLWETIEPVAAPLTGIRLVDATDHIFRAPEVLFDASEIDLPAFGYNVANSDLTRALEAAAETRLARITTRAVTSFESTDSGAFLTTADGETVTASLVAAADGRNSFIRRYAGIPVTDWSYPQIAVVTSFAHPRPHNGVSTELHRPSGPLTVVPGPGNTSSLVWVETPREAERLLRLDDDGFIRALNTHIAPLLGPISALAPRRSYPLSGQTAMRFGKGCVVLIGEAGHVVPPIGAQGLNLGFRDAAALAEIAAAARSGGSAIGAPETVDRYDRSRRADVASRVFAVNLLNRSLLTSFPGVNLARGAGLAALAASRTLRQQAMREGVSPSLAPLMLTAPIAAGVGKAAPGLDAPSPSRA
ncbi:ubiquinone biosynthesis protein UbiH [Hyphomicrobium methylovorum]|uniref:FAD-dependent monooxygenase n=1 Tax=Hyphomicrobium methylovorum TaxID=84 RepID=UPI0015E725D6|nr:ubiquinone biosynthesis protein UbiH [Hyphomicrobium methylovorum]